MIKLFPFHPKPVRNRLTARLARATRADRLVENDPPRLAVQPLVELPELFHDRLGLARRVHLRVERRNIDEMQQEPGAREMAQKLVPEAGALGGASIKPGMSAITKLRFMSARTTPSWGCRVVNG